MNIYDAKKHITKLEEMKILDKRAKEMKEAYNKTHEVYFLIMLKSIARKQERLSCDLKFVEV